MKRNIIIVCIILIIVSVCIVEELILHNTSDNLLILSQNLSQSLIESDTINSQENLDNYNKLNDFWKSSKRTLCFLTNYEKIRTLDESIIKLGTALQNDDKSLVVENISIIKSFNEFSHYFMGFNINNLL